MQFPYFLLYICHVLLRQLFQLERRIWEDPEGSPFCWFFLLGFPLENIMGSSPLERGHGWKWGIRKALKSNVFSGFKSSCCGGGVVLLLAELHDTCFKGLASDSHQVNCSSSPCSVAPFLKKSVTEMPLVSQKTIGKDFIHVEAAGPVRWQCLSVFCADSRQ